MHVPMALPTASSVKDDLEKEQINAVTMVTKAINSTGDNGGGGSGSGSGGSVNTIFEEELKENAILPSHENLKSFVTHG